ncbi:MAG: 2Fe-2S iron-sulfur cluster-binding protein [Planctomycetota bacterium]|nr:2Fe-2S iron-sulfur cluster-binding protein [Planctomycetota bacterium]
MADNKPTITIDGQVLAYEPGQTVIQVAHEAGFDVPHYCYHPGLSIAGNCRICMVEVDGWPKPQVSCKLQPSPGMVVHTQSALAKSARAGTMEMLLVNHPLDCPICDQAGECHLQDYSYQLGQGEASSTTAKTKLPKNVAFGEKIVYDAERCIKCTLCVRFCEEITQTNELAMSGRGDHEIVIMTSKGEFDTAYSMNIIDLCPVGALTSRDFRFKSRLWFMDFTESLCTGCARGCNVVTGGRDGAMLRMEPRANAEVNQWWLCDEGRLDYAHVNGADRIASPRIKTADGVWVQATVDDAITAAAVALREAGGDVLLDGGCTLEEMLLARDLAKVMGGKARYAAATGGGDKFLRVDERGANAKGAEGLGLARATKAAAAAVVIVERDAHVPAALRDGAAPVVVFATDAASVPASARVVFPHGSWAERDGLLVNTDGRIQVINRNPAVGPDNIPATADVLEEILGELDPAYDWRGRGGLHAALRSESAFAKAQFPAMQSAGVGVGA